MRSLSSVILLLLLFTLPVQADDMSAVRQLLKTRIDAVVLLLQDKEMDKTRRNQEIIDIVTPIFDYQTMAKLSLGKKYWPSLSEEKRAAFSTVFIARLQQSYLSKLDIYSNEEVIYGAPQASGKMIHVPSTLISKNNRIDMLYKFYQSKAGWLIYDVEIGGVSVIQTYRSQFDGVLSEGTIDDLIEKLNRDDAFDLPGAGAKGVQPG